MEPTKEGPEAQPLRALAQRAVGYAKAFHKVFDFAPGSIVALEEILQYYHEDMKRSAPTDRQIHSMALIWGAYLGETILRSGGTGAGYAWATVGGKPVLQKPDAWEIAPVGKIEKRLRRGPEECIQSFYDMSLLIIEGKVTVP